jgi:adhesin/invasin
MSSVRSARSLATTAIFVALAAASACSGDSTGPATPTAARLEVTAGATQTATVGTAVPAVPAVKAVSSTGAPVPGVRVTFTVASGAGTVGSASATTRAGGVASAGSWTLGAIVGAQTLRADATGLAPVTFTATAIAGPATQLAVSTGNNQTALTGAALATKPAVIVRDAGNNPVSGAAVTFTVATGGGSITGGTATTDANGVAAVGGWTLGIVPGAQTLRATVGTMTTTITATASLPTGCVPAPYAIGATITGAWATGDCASPGARGIFDPAGALYDQYEFTIAAQTQFRATVAGPTDRSLRIRRKDTGEMVAQMAGTAFNPSNATDTLRLEYVLAAGAYVMEVQSATAGATGAYTISTALDNTVTCTPAIFGTPDITITDAVDPATDCAFMGGYEDRLIMILPAGLKLRLSLTSTEMAPFLVFRDDRLAAASPTLITARQTTPGTATVDWTTTFSGYYEVIMTTLDAARGQKYTLKIERQP